jgi:malate dehydrogenase
MDIAIVGAAGACGRQLAVQLLESSLLHQSSRLQLVGHHGGAHENELWGLRADLEDAFIDFAPAIEVVLDADDVAADIVVMLAGRTLSTDPTVVPDRVALGRANAAVFSEYARALGAQRDRAPIVIVQSNPVELGVEILAEAVGRHRVVGAGAWSDTLRFRQELSRDLGVRRPAVVAPMLGQHGDHLVPAWSHVHARGIAAASLAERLGALRAGRAVVDLPAQIQEVRASTLELIRDGQIEAAYELVSRQPPDIRTAVKPFFTHFTAGHTTEVVTARSVSDIVHAIVEGHRRVMPAQVLLAGEWQGIHGVVGAPVVVGPDGWTGGIDMELAEDEHEAIHAAAAAIADANAQLR